VLGVTAMCACVLPGMVGCAKTREDEMAGRAATEFYSSQGAITDPGPHADMYDGLPTDVGELVKIVQGVVIGEPHIYGAKIPRARVRKETNIRKVEDMLAALKDRDDRPLTFQREPADRVVGCCRHFAVMLTSLLRHVGIPARARGGFRTYFHRSKHHDHWICEYWSEGEKRWVRVDAEIDELRAAKWKVGYDPLDVPAEAFITGGQAWLRCRRGEDKPKSFGVMADKWQGGWGFVQAEVLLDLWSLDKVEMLPWDKAGLSEVEFDDLTEEQLELLDAVAEATAGPTVSRSALRELTGEPGLRPPEFGE